MNAPQHGTIEGPAMNIREHYMFIRKLCVFSARAKKPKNWNNIISTISFSVLLTHWKICMFVL